MFPVIPKKNSGHLLQHRVHPMELRIGSGSLRKMSECSCCVCISRDRSPSSVSWMNGWPLLYMVQVESWQYRAQFVVVIVLRHMEASCCLVGGVVVWVGNESGQVLVTTLMRMEVYCLLLVWRISTKTSFWFKSVGCVGALA